MDEMHTHDCECVVASCAACMTLLGVTREPSGHFIWVPDTPASLTAVGDLAPA